MKRKFDYRFAEQKTEMDVLMAAEKEETGRRMILGHATFMAAVHYAMKTGRLELLPQNLKRLAIRPLLQKMVYCLGGGEAFDTEHVEVLMSKLEIERLLELSSKPRDTFELAYATGMVLQQYYAEEGASYRLLFSAHLQDATALFDGYQEHVERWGKGINLEKIMDKLAYD